MLNDINARIGEIDADIETLASLVDPTPEDVARTAALITERTQVIEERDAALERQRVIAEAAAQVRANRVSTPAFQHMQRVDPYGEDLRNLEPGQITDAARSILERNEARHVATGGKEKAERLLGKHGERLAGYFVAGSRPEYRSAFAKYVSGNEMLLTNDERRAVADVKRWEARASLALADANGGYAVPPLLDPSVILANDGTSNPFRQISRIVTGMDDTWRGVTSAGITASWDGEATEVSDDSPTLAQPTVVAKAAQAFVSFSMDIEEDWGGLASDMATMFADAKDRLESTAFATGTQPIGIITALVAGSGTVSNPAPTTDGQLGAVDVRGLFTALPPRYRSNASWVMSLDTMNEVRSFDNGTLGTETVSLRDGYGFPILGRPVYESSAFPDFTGTTGVANIMVVGDFRNYVIFDRIGGRVELVPHLFATNANLPNGQRGLFYRWRTGADSIVDNAFRLLRNV